MNFRDILMTAATEGGGVSLLEQLKTLLAGKGKSAIWVPTDRATVFTDAGVTAAGYGAKAYRVNDVSGNGAYWQQTAEAQRPLVTNCLLFDQADDWTESAFSGGAGSTDMTVVAGVFKNTGGSVTFAKSYVTGTAFIGAAADGSSASAGSISGTPTYYIDGAQVPGGTSPTRDQLYDAWPAAAVRLEVRNADLHLWPGFGMGYYTSTYLGPSRVAAVVLIDNTALTAPAAAQALSLAQQFIDQQNALAQPLNSFSDTLIAAHRGSHRLTSPFAQAVFDTTATSITVESFNNIYGTYPEFCEIGIYVDGVFDQAINPSAAGYSINQITLPSGSKRVSLVNGLQSRPSSTILGTFVTGVTGNATLTPVTLSHTTKVAFLVDSIGVGANADVPSEEGALMLTRSAAPAGTGVIIHGFGYAALWDFAKDSTTRASTVALLSGIDVVYFQQSTNDYSLNRWTPGNMATGLGQLLDDLHAAYPTQQVVLQTAIPRASEGTNSLGSTTGAYRTAMAGCATGRSWVSVVDGTSMGVGTGDLDDGVHLTTAGHEKWATGLKAVFGW